MIFTFSSREFNQNPSEAQKNANTAPVFITTRGNTSHVLINYAEYRKLTGKPQTAKRIGSIDSHVCRPCRQTGRN